jgi:hypothetical protein
MDAHNKVNGTGEQILLRRGIAAAGLLVFFLLVLEAATSTSPTADEGMHMLRGRVIWQTGDLNFQGQHTPLSHRLIGALYSLEPALPDVTKLPSWSIQSPDQLVQEFVWKSGGEVDRLLLISRLPIIFIGTLFGAFLARWSWSQYGKFGLIITVVLFAFSPNLLASAALATTDLLAAVTFTVAILALWRFWGEPSFGRWLLVGIALGLGLSAKLTGALLLPLFFFISYIYKKGRPWWQPGLIWLSWLPVAGLILWAVYGFELGTVPSLPFIVPGATYIQNFLEVQEHIDRGHFAYLFGQRSNEGWYSYFIIAFLLKTPLVTIALVVVATIYLIRSRGWKTTIFLWLPVLFVLAAASYSRLNIGYRHILPALPLLWLMIAATAPFWRERPFRQRILFAALALYAVLALRQTPHFLAYFNELVGGSSQGYRYLGDSNIDWGQDLPALSSFVEENSIEPLFISYFGPSDPSYYGIGLKPMFDPEGMPTGFAPANPESGRYVISVNHWQGTTEVEPDLFDWFRDQKVADRVGFSLLVFDVKSSSSGSWIAHCFDPEPLVDQAFSERLVGEEELRHIYFDCRNSWVIPEDGSTPGWYILPAEFEVDNLDGLFPKELSKVYTNQNSPKYPAYSVYYWRRVDSAADMILENAAFPEVGGQVLNPPIRSGEIAHFLGAMIIDNLWVSIWQVQDPIDLPLSVQIHLHSGPIDPLVGDGLGYAPIQWGPGDIFFQFVEGPDDSYRTMETSLYNYSTGEIIPFTVNGNSVDSLIIPRPD